MDSSQTDGEGSGDRERYRMLRSECKHTDRTLMPRMLSWLIGGRFRNQEVPHPGKYVLFLADGLEIETKDITENLRLY